MVVVGLVYEMPLCLNEFDHRTIYRPMAADDMPGYLMSIRDFMAYARTRNIIRNVIAMYGKTPKMATIIFVN